MLGLQSTGFRVRKEEKTQKNKNKNKKTRYPQYRVQIQGHNQNLLYSSRSVGGYGQCWGSLKTILTFFLATDRFRNRWRRGSGPREPLHTLYSFVRGYSWHCPGQTKVQAPCCCFLLLLLLLSSSSSFPLFAFFFKDSGTHSVDQAGLKLRGPSISAS